MKNCTTHHNACDCREAQIAAQLAAKDAEVAALRRALAYFPPCDCNTPEAIHDATRSGTPGEQCPRCSLPEDIRRIIEGANTIAKERTDP